MMNILAKLVGRSAGKGVTWLDADELSTLLTSAAAPLVIDVRGSDEFSGPLGHIETARNIPLDQIAAQSSALIGAARPLVFVCHTDRRSSAAAEHLRRVGGTDISVLRGGMVAWRSRPNR